MRRIFHLSNLTLLFVVLLSLLAPPRVSAQLGSTIIVDNAHADRVMAQGKWNSYSSATLGYGIDYLNDGNIGKGQKSFRYFPAISQSGTYSVALYQTGSSNYAASVPVDIVRPGKSPVTVNLARPPENQWVKLGEYDFEAGPGNMVAIRTTGTRGYVMADALSLQRIDDPKVITIDNSDTTHVTKTGNWKSSTTFPRYWLGDYLDDGNTGKGAKSVAFNLAYFPRDRYQVYLRWTEGANRASNAKVNITDAGGLKSLTVNQKVNGGVWVPLGAYDLGAGSNGKLVVSNLGSNGFVVADAVMVERRGIVLDNADLTGIAIHGNWTVTAGVPGAYDNNLKAFPNGRYLHDGNKNKEEKWVDYTPEFLRAGWYETFVRWSESGNHASAVYYDLRWPEQSVTVGPWDQRKRPNEWISIGKYVFDAGHTGTVRVRAAGTTGYVAADAMQFVKIEDGDQDGMSDDFEVTYGLDFTSDSDALLDLDRDGLSNLEEFQQNGDPADYYRQGAVDVVPILQKVSGENQTGHAEELLPEPMVLRVVNAQNKPLPFAPLTFAMTEGGAWLARTGGETELLSKSLGVLSDQEGLARVYLFGPQQGEVGLQKVTATAGSAQPLIFEATIDGEAGGGLVGWWKMEEIGGDMISDSSGAGNDGIRIDNPESVAGPFGFAAAFSTGSQSLEIPSSPSLVSGRESFTLVLWFKMAGRGIIRPLMSKLADDGYRLVLYGGKVEFDLIGEEAFEVKTERSFDDGLWHQAVVLVDQDRKTLRILVDGKAQALSLGNSWLNLIDLEGTEVEYSALADINLVNTAPVVFGKEGERSFYGALDEARIYRKVLNAGEIRRLTDNDNDSLPDAWEIQYFGNLLPIAGGDEDMDQQSNLEEFFAGSDPRDFYNGAERYISIVSGNDQAQEPGDFLSDPLKVQVLDSLGRPMSGVEVIFTATEGELGSHQGGAPLLEDSFIVRTDSEGYAAANYRAPTEEGAELVRVEASHLSVQAQFHLATYHGASSGGGTGGNRALKDEAREAGIPEFYSLVSLPMPDNAGFGDAMSMNTSGEIVGNIATDYVSNAVVWRNGSLVDLSEDDEPNSALGISDSGKIIVQSGHKGAVFDSAVIVGNGSENFAPLVINASGTYAGIKTSEMDEWISVAFRSSDGGIEYFDHRESGKWFTNDESPTNRSSAVLGISPSGRVVGFMNIIPPKVHPSDYPKAGPGGQVAVEFTGGNPTPLIPPNMGEMGYNDSQALAVNDNNIIAGYESIQDVGTNALVWDGGKKRYLGRGVAFGVNKNNVVIGYLYGKGYVIWFKKDNLWKSLPIKDLIPPDSGWEVTSLNSITDSGAILGSAWQTLNEQGDPLPEEERIRKPVVLMAADLAVDANRDGVIKFAGNADDPEIADAPRDLTTREKPFRFWINDDDDFAAARNSNETGEIIPVQKADWDEGDNRGAIDGSRDLEDFTRLWICFGAMEELIAAGKIKMGLKWKDTGGTHPVINIYRAEAVDGSLGYLKSENSALRQVQGDYFTAKLKVEGDQAVLFPNQVWEGMNAESPPKYFLFEGCKTGEGKLVITYHDENGKEIGEGQGVYIKLLNVREMYERARIPKEAPDIPNPWDNLDPGHLSWTWDPWYWAPDIDPEVEAKTIVFVHGWRMPYEEYLSWGDTSFKRLWQMGYKGRFYTFRWPTFSGETNGIDLLPSALAPEGFETYNQSEYRAWLSGPVLANFVNSLPNENARYLIAHSMGNVVSGAALLNNMHVTRYAMCNSAMAAMAYDGTAVDFEYSTPDTDTDFDTRRIFGLADKLKDVPTPIVSFGLGPDAALGSWEDNNKYFKPQWNLRKGYYRYKQGEIRVKNLNA